MLNLVLNAANQSGRRVFFGQIQELRSGFSTILLMMFMVGFLIAIVKIWGSANAIHDGDMSKGKTGIYAAALIAGAGVIATIAFKAFGLDGAVVGTNFGP